VVRKRPRWFAERLVIDHPTFMLGASMDEVRHWVKLGTIEHIAACTTQYWAHHRHVPWRRRWR
jgi:hypothetical protein